jgi:adenosylhomocysteine nucleosidase
VTVVVLISANAEWRAVGPHFPQAIVAQTPYGEWFAAERNGVPLVFVHGGWGKISAAATAQYAITRWQPDLLINLGTCGGFLGRVKRGEILLVERTLVYDLIEQMETDPEQAIRFYSTTLDLSWLRQPYPQAVRRSLLVSADRDIVAGDIAGLIERYQAVAADWESGAIAWIAARNATRCLILRGVSDLVGADGGEAYQGPEFFQDSARRIMDSLIAALPGWLAAATSSPVMPDR